MPSAKPTSSIRSNRTARGMVIVANSRVVSTGTVFWAMRTRSRIARQSSRTVTAPVSRSA